MQCGSQAVLGILAGSSLACGSRKALVDNPTFPPQASVPEGMAPHAFNLPVAAGGIAADAPDSVTSASAVTAAVQRASMMGSTMASANTLTAAVGLMVPMACTLLSSLTINADTKLGLNLAANLASQGQAVASLGAFSNCVCAMVSDGNTTADLKGLARLEAQLTTAGDVLTANAVAIAVWTYLSRTLTAGGGGGGLTQQDVRDAMLLAASAGTPAAGSVDAKLDDIGNNTGLIPALL